MLQDIFPILELVLVGNPLSVEKVGASQQAGRHQLVETIRVLPLFQVINLQRILNLVKLGLVDQTRGGSNVDGFNPGIHKWCIKLGLK